MCVTIHCTEDCDLGYLRDYVLDKGNDINSADLAQQIANGQWCLGVVCTRSASLHAREVVM